MKEKIFSQRKFIQLLTVLLLLLSCTSVTIAQYYPKSFYRTAQLDTTYENSLLFRIENSNFLKNNEYFNDIIQGYTLIGNFFHPKLVYYPSKNAKIEAGVHLLQFYGVDSYTDVIPTLTFQYKINKAIDVVIGTLYGNTNHELLEPILRYENFFTDNIENGLQFLFDTKIYKGDIWIDWQQFIFKGDDKQEIFTAGISNRFFLKGKEKKHSFSVPLQTVFVHQGGQINETKEKLITYNTSAAGLSYTFKPTSSLFKSINLESSYVNFLDMSTDHQLPYIQGYGIYSTATVKVLDFDLRVAHWYSEYYFTLRGHPIFSSKSTIWPGYYENQRAMVTTRVLYEKNILKGLDIGAGFEVYGDLFDYFADYWYMFYINFNRDFFIKKFK